MCLEIWIMRIAVSNVVSEYSLGGVGSTHRVRDMMFAPSRPAKPYHTMPRHAMPCQPCLGLARRASARVWEGKTTP